MNKQAGIIQWESCKNALFILNVSSILQVWYQENALFILSVSYQFFRLGIKKLEDFLKPLVNKGLRSVLLFGVPSKLQKVE